MRVPVHIPASEVLQSTCKPGKTEIFDRETVPTQDTMFCLGKWESPEMEKMLTSQPSHLVSVSPSKEGGLPPETPAVPDSAL